ncbi:MAG: hypothetical protein WCL14_07585 [Bacteroidota bacterium]
MTKIIKKLLPVLLPLKWIFGKRISFAKYDVGYVRIKVKEIYIKLLFHDIMYITGEGGYTIYHMQNGTNVLDSKSLGASCRNMPGNHYGRYRKDLAHNHHFHSSHTRLSSCEIVLKNGFFFETSRDEATRFRDDMKLFEVGFGMKIRRIRIIKAKIIKKIKR